MARVLGIAAELSAPPSSPTSFREISMIAATVRGYTVVALSPRDFLDAYSRWFRVYGLFDYVEDLLPREQIGDELTVEIEGGRYHRLTAHNVNAVLAAL